MDTSSTPRANDQAVVCQVGPLYLSLRHVGDEHAERGTTRHRYGYLVIDQESAGQEHQAEDLHNQGTVDTDAAMCLVISYLWATGLAYPQDSPGMDDGALDDLPTWLQRSCSTYANDLLRQLVMYEELLSGPIDLTFTFDDVEPSSPVT